MTSDKVGEAQWSQLGELIAERMGLNFPRERWADLERGVASAAHDLGFADASAYVESLLSTPPTKAQIQALANHLTIGETYFFRDTPLLQAISDDILPGIIRERRGRDQRLRIWSAACATGEEPYTLAIVLHRLLPDLPHWKVTITATDINARLLQKAAAGTYGEWSFRSAPARLTQRYFTRTASGRYAIIPEIKRMVSFEYLNLVEDIYPSLATDTNAMDVIFCRNVLMYFRPLEMCKVIDCLHHALVEGGWLVVSPSEASQALFPQFAVVNFPGAIFYRKIDSTHRNEVMTAPIESPQQSIAPVVEAALRQSASSGATRAKPVPAPAPADALATAESLYAQGHYAEAADTLLAASPAGAAAFSLLARALANEGRLADAVAWLERWIAADKTDPAAHYLRAIVLLEHGEPSEARASLQRAVYLRPDFVLAHFALGNLALHGGKRGESKKHFANALQLLARHAPDNVLAESEGLTAARLTETILALTAPEDAP